MYRDAPSDLNQDRLNAVVPVPVSEDGELRRVDLSVYLAHKRKVDTGHELHGRRLVRVVLATGNSKAVDAVLVDGL